MKTAIVGLPLSGKTTLFNALTGMQVDTAAFIGGKKEAHQAIVPVPDERLERLNEIFNPRKKVPANVEYIDSAGMAADEQKKGFSDQFLGQIRNVDALVLVVRAFSNANVPHPFNSVNPLRDLESVQADFIISDLAIVENRMNRLEKQMRVKKNDQDVREHAVLEKFKKLLEEEKPLRLLDLPAEEEILIRGYQFLTLKPLIIVLNINESDVKKQDSVLKGFEAFETQKNTLVLPIPAQIEMEMQQLSPEEAEVFRSDLGITQSAMDKLIRTSYDLLGLISFFTVGEDEVRAWTIHTETRAPQAAGAVHTDIERGFIRAEVVHYDEFIARGSLAKCRTDGVLRLEGREYLVKDGDIINFRFAI
jgi:GTP-binding protein YchF